MDYKIKKAEIEKNRKEHLKILKKILTTRKDSIKLKYVKIIVEFSFSENADFEIWSLLIIFRERYYENEIICWKLVQILHKLMLKGHSKMRVLNDFRLSELQRINEHYKKNLNYGRIISTYFKYIVMKSNFHHMYKEVDGEFNIVDKELLKIFKKSSKIILQFVDIGSRILDLAIIIINLLLIKASTITNYDEEYGCILFPIVFIVPEVKNMQRITTLALHIIHKYANYEELETYRKNSKLLKERLKILYDKISKIDYINQFINIAELNIEDTANVYNLMIDSIDENINKQDAKNKGNEVGDKLIEPRVEKRPVKKKILTQRQSRIIRSPKTKHKTKSNEDDDIQDNFSSVEDSLVAKIAQVKKLKEKNAYLEKQISLLKSIKNKNTTRNENIDDLNEIIKELKEKNTKLNEKNVALSSQYKMANELLTKEKITMNKTLIELSNAENQLLSLKEETKNNLKPRHEFIHHLENEKSICDVEEKNPELIIQKEPEIEQHNERFDPPPFSEIHDDNFLLIGKFNKELLNSLKRDIEQPLQLYSKIEQVLYAIRMYFKTIEKQLNYVSICNSEKREISLAGNIVEFIKIKCFCISLMYDIEEEAKNELIGFIQEISKHFVKLITKFSTNQLSNVEYKFDLYQYGQLMESMQLLTLCMDNVEEKTAEVLKKKRQDSLEHEKTMNELKIKHDKEEKIRIKQEEKEMIENQKKKQKELKILEELNLTKDIIIELDNSIELSTNFEFYLKTLMKKIDADEDNEFNKNILDISNNFINNIKGMFENCKNVRIKEEYNKMLENQSIKSKLSLKKSIKNLAWLTEKYIQVLDSVIDYTECVEILVVTCRQISTSCSKLVYSSRRETDDSIDLMDILKSSSDVMRSVSSVIAECATIEPSNFDQFKDIDKLESDEIKILEIEKKTTISRLQNEIDKENEFIELLEGLENYYSDDEKESNQEASEDDVEELEDEEGEVGQENEGEE